MIDKEFIQSQKTELEKQKVDLTQTIAENKKFVDMGQSDDEQALEFEAFQGSQAMIKNAEDELGQIEVSLKKIEDGTYGKCSVCGENIERGRLKAYPAADKCVTHANS